MNVYEIMYILDQDLTEEQVNGLKDKLNTILLRDGGEIQESADWGIKKFEYPINKKTKGYYFVLILKTTSANVDEFKRIAGIDKNVVRTFVLNTAKEENYEASVKLSKTEVRNDRFENKKPGRRFERRTDMRSEEAAPAEAKVEETTTPVAE